MEPGPPAVEAQSPTHQTAREFPKTVYFKVAKNDCRIYNTMEHLKHRDAKYIVSGG